jgi:hypothetical protein
LGVPHPLDSLDDFIAMGQKESKQFDMCLKRHLAGTRWAGLRPAHGTDEQSSTTSAGAVTYIGQQEIQTDIQFFHVSAGGGECPR